MILVKVLKHNVMQVLLIQE